MSLFKLDETLESGRFKVILYSCFWLSYLERGAVLFIKLLSVLLVSRGRTGRLFCNVLLERFYSLAVWF